MKVYIVPLHYVLPVPREWAFLGVFYTQRIYPTLTMIEGGDQA